MLEAFYGTPVPAACCSTPQPVQAFPQPATWSRCGLMAGLLQIAFHSPPSKDKSLTLPEATGSAWAAMPEGGAHQGLQAASL